MRIGSAAAWRHWFTRGWPLWVSVLLAAGGLVAWWMAPHTQTTVRRVGLAYEVIGVVVVLVEMARSMMKHGVAWPHVRLFRYLLDVPIIHRKLVINASAALEGNFGVAAAGTLTAAVGRQSIEQRVAQLEGQIATLVEGLGKLDTRIAREEAVRATAIADEAREREAGDSKLGQDIKQIEVGSLELSLLGILWLLVGMVLTTGTQEACDWLLRCAK